MSGATVEDKWPRDNLAARSPRTVIYGIYAAAGKEIGLFSITSA
jgi:hypothetical protein